MLEENKLIINIFDNVYKYRFTYTFIIIIEIFTFVYIQSNIYCIALTCARIYSNRGSTK